MTDALSDPRQRPHADGGREADGERWHRDRQHADQRFHQDQAAETDRATVAARDEQRRLEAIRAASKSAAEIARTMRPRLRVDPVLRPQFPSADAPREERQQQLRTVSPQASFEASAGQRTGQRAVAAGRSTVAERVEQGALDVILAAAVSVAEKHRQPAQTASPQLASILPDGRRDDALRSQAAVRSPPLAQSPVPYLGHEDLKQAFDRVFDPHTKDRELRHTFNAIRVCLRALDRGIGHDLDDGARVRLRAALATTLNGVETGQRHKANYSLALVEVARVGAKEIRTISEHVKVHYREGNLAFRGGDLHEALFRANKTAQNAEKFSEDYARRHSEIFGDYHAGVRKVHLPDGKTEILNKQEAILERQISDRGEALRSPQENLLPERKFSLPPDVVQQSAQQQRGWISAHQEALSKRDQAFERKDDELARLADHFRRPEVARPLAAAYIESHRAYREACRQRDIATDRWDTLRQDPNVEANTLQSRILTDQVRELNHGVREAKQAMERSWATMKKSDEVGMAVSDRRLDGKRLPTESSLQRTQDAPKSEASDRSKGRAEGRSEGSDEGRELHAPVPRPALVEHARERSAAVNKVISAPADWVHKV